MPASARDALDDLRSRALGAQELIELVIERARSSDLGAIELLDEEGARAQARDADGALACGEAGSLAGLPIVVKDVIDVRGLPTRGGTASWLRVARADAASVAALRAAGAVVVGKAHTNELAFGIDGRNPHRPPCRNPSDPGALPGGSSSGPAVALAGGLALGALGTDTSGSIRVPAALCGVAGLRPTWGRISLAGVQALAPSYDVVGPMASSVADLSLLWSALRDGAATAAWGASARSRPATTAAAVARARIRRVAVVAELLDPAVCAAAVATLVGAAADALRELGLEVTSVSVPALRDALSVHRDVQLPEAAESVRLLGVSEEELAPETRGRVRAAREIAPERHARARRQRERIARAIDEALPASGALLAPACPILAPPREAERSRLDSGSVRSIRDTLLSCTVPLTQAPGPVLSIPLPVTDGRPVGAQLLARAGWEGPLLELGMRLEAAAP